MSSLLSAIRFPPLFHSVFCPLFRRNQIYCISDDELSPAALAARVVLLDVMRALVRHGGWPGATLLDS